MVALLSWRSFLIVASGCTLAGLIILASRESAAGGPDGINREKQAMTLARGFQLEESGRVRSAIVEFTSHPHPMGSQRQEYLAGWLESWLKKAGLKVSQQSFTVETPAWSGAPKEQLVPGKPGRVRQTGHNILAWIPRPEAICRVLLASHYDTKRLNGDRFVGANDGASSSVALLFLAEYLNKRKKELPEKGCELHFVWFDGEEAVLPGWNDGQVSPEFGSVDNTYGSRHYVSLLRPCRKKFLCLPDETSSFPLTSMILMDMIGDRDLRLTLDRNSDPVLRTLAKKAARSLLGKDIFASWQSIEDDHTPFIKAGIPALNLINFEKLQHWHKPTDLPKHLSLTSMESVTKIAAFLALMQTTDESWF